MFEPQKTYAWYSVKTCTKPQVLLLFVTKSSALSEIELNILLFSILIDKNHEKKPQLPIGYKIDKIMHFLSFPISKSKYFFPI